MFSLHISSIGHYQCKPRPGWDVLHSSFWSTDVCRVPVLCILGVTPTGQETCMHIHGQFPYLLVPLSRTEPESNYLHTFAARLEDAINADVISSTTCTQHVFSISHVSGRLKSEGREVQHYMKICFYDPDIVHKAAHLLQNGTVMNTCFQPLSAHIPFFLQFLIDQQVFDVNHVHVSAFKFRRLSKGLDGEKRQVSTLTENNVCRPASDLASVRWKNINEFLSVSSPSHCNTCAIAGSVLHWDLENMPSERLSPACVERQSLSELEVDVMAADIHGHQLRDKNTAEVSLVEVWAGLLEESSSLELPWSAALKGDHQDMWTVITSPGIPPSLETTGWPENRCDVYDKGKGPSRIDSNYDFLMDSSDQDDGEDDEEDDDDRDIPQLDGTSDETTASKKPSKKRGSGKSSKQGTSSGGLGREDSSSQGEGSNPSCSPQVQSPVMMPGGDVSLPRDQGVMSPYRHQQGSFPYQGGYYRQWGESGMVPGMGAMSHYPGYPATSAGWGQSSPPQGSHPFIHRFPGNSFGYYPYPRHHPYNPSFRQNGAQNSRQQSNFSPPARSPVSSPSYPGSGPAFHPHSSASPQQYGHFMSPQAAALRRHSDGNVAQQDRQFNGPTDWQYPVPFFNSWGYAQGVPSGPTQSMPPGSAHSMPAGSAHSMPPRSAHSMPSGLAHSMPSGPAQSNLSGPAQDVSSGPGQAISSGAAQAMSSVPAQVVPSRPAQCVLSGSGQSMPSGSVLSMPPGSGQSMPSGSAQSMPPGSAQSMPSESAQSMPPESAQSMPSGTIQSISSRPASGPSRSISLGSTHGMPSGPAQGMPSGLGQIVPSRQAQMSSGPVQNLSSGPTRVMPSGSVQNMLSGSVQDISSRSVQERPSGTSQDILSGTAQDNPSESADGMSSRSPVPSHHDMVLECSHGCTLESTQDMTTRSAQSMPSGPVPDKQSGLSSARSAELCEEMPSRSTQIMPSGTSQDMPAEPTQDMIVESAISQSVGSSGAMSNDLPTTDSQGVEAVVSSSGSSLGELQRTSQDVPMGSSDVLTRTSSAATPVSSQCVPTNTTSSGSLCRSPNSSLETCITSSVSFPSGYNQNMLTDSSNCKPAKSPHAVPSQSSANMSSGSAVLSSGYTHPGSCPPVSAGSSHAVPGSSQGMSPNWWPALFLGGPRPMGYGPFSPMQRNPVAGQRHMSSVQNNMQIAGGLGQPSSVANSQNPPGQDQLCGMQNIPISTAHGQPFPTRRNTQNLTGPRHPVQNIYRPSGQRHPGPPQNIYSPSGQRQTAPPQNILIPPGQGHQGSMQESTHGQLEQSKNSGNSFQSDQNIRQSQIPAGPPEAGCSTLPCDRNRWQSCGNPPPSTLQGLLSAPDSSRGTSYSRRAMSMDCSSSDFHTSPTRGPDWSDTGRQEFKQPQKRSGSFSSPLGFSAGGGAPSALSNLYNFVSNVDPMARTPTPTSRNSTPSSTPHSDPSPNLGQKQEEEMSLVDMGMGSVKWQSHHPSPQPQPVRSTAVDEVFGSSVAHLPPSISPLMCSSVGSSKSSVNKEQAGDSDNQTTGQSESSEMSDKGYSKENTPDPKVVMCNKEVSCNSLDVSPLTTDCKSIKKENTPGNRMATSSRKESSTATASSSGSSVVSERLGKQSRMKKLGLTVNTSRRVSEDKVGSPPVTPIPCAAYTFTFHVPTPVYKRFKMHAVFPNRVSSDIRLVRMHPMDARRYSLLKIGRELVRVSRLSARDLPNKAAVSPASCTEDGASWCGEHNSLIDPHTGELLSSLPGVDVEGDGQTTVQSSSQGEGTEQRQDLLEPQCTSAQNMVEGSCQTSLDTSDPQMMSRANSGQDMQCSNETDSLSTVHSVPLSVAPDTVHTQTNRPDTASSDSSQSWQALDRDRRPSVKVEYPAQRSSSGSDPWSCGQPPPHSWAGGMWGYGNSGPGQWGEQWQSTNQPSAWNEGQSYNYGPWMGGTGGFQQPAASSMYQCNTWSAAPPSASSFISQPSVSTSHCQSMPAGSASSAGQVGMGPMAQGHAFPHSYPSYGNSVYNQHAAFPPIGPHNSGGGKPTPHSSSSMGAETFPFRGGQPAQAYSHNMGHSPYHSNYPMPGYHSGGEGRKGLCQPGFGATHHQQPGGMTGLPQENLQYGQYGNPTSFGGYNAAGPVSTLPAAPPPGPGPGPGPAQFAGQPGHMYSASQQQGPFTAPSQQLGHFFQPNHFSHQSGQFQPPLSQASSVPPHSGQAGCNPPNQQGHMGNPQCPVSSDSGSQGCDTQDSRQQEKAFKSLNQQRQSLETPGHQNQPPCEDDKTECSSDQPQVSESSVNSRDLHTPEQESFLQQAACQALTTTVCERSVHSAQNMQSDRPATNTFDKNTDTPQVDATVHQTSKMGVSSNCAKHTKSKHWTIHDNVESTTLQNVDDNCGNKDQKKSTSKCSLKGKGTCSSENNKQQVNNMTYSRQNVRRSSVQLWSDGDSDSGEDNSDDNEESSDDYHPSSKLQRKGQKRRSSRRQSQTEVKRTKRSSVNYDAHAFSKYLDHGFEKKGSYRLRQSHNQKDKKKKMKRKEDSLIEGVHYIVVGKFKGHRVMLVKVDRVKVKLDERVKVSDWQRTGGRTPSRLQGPRCRRIAKGTPPDDPSFVHPDDNVESETERDEPEDSSCVKKDETLSSDTRFNHRIKLPSCAKEEGGCDFKKAIKLEMDQSPFFVHGKGDVSHKRSDSLIKNEPLDEADKGSLCAIENGIVKASFERAKSEAEVTPQNQCLNVKPQRTKSEEIEVSIATKHCAVVGGPYTPKCILNSEQEGQQVDSSGRPDHSASHSPPASCPGADSPGVSAGGERDLPESNCLHADVRSTDVDPTLQVQSPMSLSENEQPMEGMCAAISLSLLEGQTSC